jgi:hypothetical protein
MLMLKDFFYFLYKKCSFLSKLKYSDLYSMDMGKSERNFGRRWHCVILNASSECFFLRTNELQQLRSNGLG